MALKTLTLLLAAGGAAYAVYRLGQRPALDALSTGSSAALGQASEDSADLADSVDSADVARPTAAMPNEGERLQELKLVNVGIGSAGDTSEEDLLAPRRGEAQQSEAIKPGLPDFARGA